jgi:hypothetical protein
MTQIFGKKPDPEYVFQEYPKWITLPDGNQVLANNKDEEIVLTGSEKEVKALLGDDVPKRGPGRPKKEQDKDELPAPDDAK